VDNRKVQSMVRSERFFRPYKLGELFFMKVVPKRSLTVVGGRRQKLTEKLQYRYTGPHRVIEVLNPIVYVAMVDNKIKIVHALRMKRDPSTVREYIPMANDILNDNEVDDTLLSEELLIEDDEANEGHFSDFWQDHNEEPEEAEELAESEY